MKNPKKPQSVSIAPGAVATPEGIGELLQFREDSLTAQLGGAMARAMKGAGPSGMYLLSAYHHSDITVIDMLLHGDVLLYCVLL